MKNLDLSLGSGEWHELNCTLQKALPSNKLGKVKEEEGK